MKRPAISEALVVIVLKALCTAALAGLTFLVIERLLPATVSARLSTTFGILGFLGAVLAWMQGVRLELLQKRQEERMSERIEVVLRYEPGGDEPPVERTLEHRPRRGSFTRAELQGLLGTIERDANHEGGYRLRHLEKRAFIEDVDRIADPGSRVRRIIIPYSEKQFAWDHEEPPPPEEPDADA